MQLDKITEAIAHFIGLFQIATEQNRLRDDYLEFRALMAKNEAPPQNEQAPLSFQSPYDLDKPAPGLHYVPAKSTLEPFMPALDVAFAAPQIPGLVEMQPGIYPGYVVPQYLEALHATTGIRLVEPQLAPPGSIATHIGQANVLADSDFVAVGVSVGQFQTIGTPNIALDSLIHNAAQFQPVPTLETLDSPAAIGALITDAAASLNAFVVSLQAQANAQGEPVEDAAPGVTTVTTQLDAPDGFSALAHTTAVVDPGNGTIYVNGQIWENGPKLDDFLPAASPLAKSAAEAPADPVPESGHPGGTGTVLGLASTAAGEEAHGQGVFSGTASVQIDTGANVLVNTAILANDALEAGVMAVAGNHVTLDAIVQINAWSDSDSIGAGMSGWGAAQNMTTSAFNIAAMQQVDIPGIGSAVSDGSTPTFPKAWVVTEITGDFVSLNWVQQLNFIIDNDLVVAASSSGVTTMIGTGENLSLNTLSLADLGKYFDLILIGGSYYDANIILQKNVMLDDDIVGAVAGFHTSGLGAASTGDNLLWNEARIVNLGSESSLAMPSGFHDTLDGFASGNKTLTNELLHDSAFEGMEGLRVLYISGSVYDLQYVQQTNILGDADQVATVMQAAQSDPGATWAVTTGSNALVNSAQIVDVDPAAKVYYGGDHYSDELLVQTDIIQTDHVLATASTDHLVTEAVAFLSDDMINTQHPETVPDAAHPSAGGGGHTDTLQIMIS